SHVSALVAAAGWRARQATPVTLRIGHSLGGAAPVVAAGQLDGVNAVVTIGAPSDAGHVVEQFKESVAEIEAEGAAQVNLAGRPFTLSRSFLEDVRAATVQDAAAALKKPLLILHAPADDVVGIDNATNLFLAAKHPKSFVSLDRADHLLTGKDDAAFVVDVISGWAGRYVGEARSVDAAPNPSGHEVLVRETLANGPFQNEVLIGGRRFLADEPKRVGGAETGPDPYEWVSAGLGACTAMTLRMYANRKDWPLARVSVGLEHAKKHADDCIGCKPSDRIDVFTRSIEIEGDLDDEQRQRLLEIADRCPVHRTLEHGAKVETRLATNPA
ncbi:MAG: bifunctional alpha/beta hydrolase/OsmC family protein, partial [Pseudomonadota bacterium]|nr:bifunctional alpha/beta hydrolase/OsmC family protein [Pseudomonadota bacterium]